MENIKIYNVWAMAFKNVVNFDYRHNSKLGKMLNTNIIACFAIKRKNIMIKHWFVQLI